MNNRSRTTHDWRHYIPLIQRKPEALRNGAPFAKKLASPRGRPHQAASTDRRTHGRSESRGDDRRSDVCGDRMRDGQCRAPQQCNFPSDPSADNTPLPTALGIHSIARHGTRVRTTSAANLVNALGVEKTQDKTDHL